MNSEFLSDILECSVCLKPLDDQNKVLPCQHTFCKSCLHSIVKSHKELRCPECRVLVSQQVDDLPSNILLIRLLDGIRFQQKQNKAEKIHKLDTCHHSIEGILDEPVPASGGAKDGGTPRTVSKPLINENGNCEISRILPKPCAIAVYAYKTNEPSDLTFSKGDTINLLKKIDKNWMSGECNGVTGVFPVNYVKILHPLPLERPFCVALYDFEVDPNDPDKDCLRFLKNDEILVIRKVDENWAEGMLNDKIGIFPLSFVKLDDEARKIIDDTPASSDESKLQRGSGAAARRLVSNKLSRKHSKKRHSFPASIADKNSCDAVTISYRHSVELGDGVLDLPTTSERSVSPENVSDSTKLSSRLQVHSSDNKSTSSSTVPISLGNIPIDLFSGVMKPAMRSESNQQIEQSTLIPSTKSSPPKIVVAAFSYKRKKSDELDLIKGDSYLVAEVCKDGWCRGNHVLSGEAGVFPGNYVTPKPHPKSTVKTTASYASNTKTSTSTETARPRARTYEEFINTQLSKYQREVDKSKPPLSARLSQPSPSSNKSSIQSNKSTASKSSNSVTRFSPDRHPIAKSRPKSAAPAFCLSSKVSPPPRPAPPNLTTSSNISYKVYRPTLKHSVSSEDGLSANLSSSQKPLKSEQKAKKLDQKGFFKKSISGGGGLSLLSSKLTSSPSSSSQPHQRHTSSKPSLKPLSRDKYITIMNYPPSDPEELELQEGDIVVVHNRRPDGWFKGTNLRTRMSGHFPSTFVEKTHL